MGTAGPGREGLNPTGSRKRLQEERRPSWIFKEEVPTPQSSMHMGAVGRPFDRVSKCERAACFGETEGSSAWLELGGGFRKWESYRGDHGGHHKPGWRTERKVLWRRAGKSDFPQGDKGQICWRKEVQGRTHLLEAWSNSQSQEDQAEIPDQETWLENYYKEKH